MFVNTWLTWLNLDFFFYYKRTRSKEWKWPMKLKAALKLFFEDNKKQPPEVFYEKSCS